MTQLVPLSYTVYQVNNEKMACNGKFLARTDNQGTIDTNGLAKHMAEHNSGLKASVIKHVFEDFNECLVEMLLQNRKVKINGLGTFYLALHSEPANSAEDFTAESIKRASIQFLADAAKDVDLTSTAIRERIVLKKSNPLPASGNDGESTGGNDEP